MHEWHITEELLEMVCNQAKGNKLIKVTRIGVTLGEDSDITEDSLRFCLESLSQKTIAKGAELDVRPTQGRDLMLVALEGE